MFLKIDYGEFNESMRAYIALPDRERKQAYLELLKENKALKSSPIAVKTDNNINDDYKIEAVDVLNVTLFKRKVIEKGKNEGEIAWVPISYEPNVKEALKTLVKREINGTGLKDFMAVVDKVDKLMEQIDGFKVNYVSESEVKE
ncbi:hypothetical protein [Clostridium guangxiense]|uniref:hypothetical protein n=1 Tax=Clostridium guangxiense TaxID=1662055 RepID=UPI001E3E6EFF|nr:hypothetical protein [Clostridium guangxiense]MCD2345785.1 hypothetical protein [Clostridium guangxiense]